MSDLSPRGEGQVPTEANAGGESDSTNSIEDATLVAVTRDLGACKGRFQNPSTVG